MVGLIGAALAGLSTAVLQNYGWGLFVGLPFTMGLSATLLFGGRQRQPLAAFVSILPVAFTGLFLLAAAAEGLICLVMAAPIALLLALLGGLTSWIILGHRAAPRVGAVRHYIFTTGEFLEPITVWEPNHLLRFSVAQQPEPIEELSPYPRLKAPHLHGYFPSQQGELRLTPLSGGRSLLAGTTWYRDAVWPSRYWQLWSDLIIHHIHLRVLEHIRHLSENGVTSATP